MKMLILILTLAAFSFNQTTASVSTADASTAEMAPMADYSYVFLEWNGKVYGPLIMWGDCDAVQSTVDMTNTMINAAGFNGNITVHSCDPYGSPGGDDTVIENSEELFEYFMNL